MSTVRNVSFTSYLLQKCTDKIKQETQIITQYKIMNIKNNNNKKQQCFNFFFSCMVSHPMIFKHPK